MEISKQELRTQETQTRLLAAAEEIFVRDGYENAQLDEIASLAGRSKGAVYTHFRSKEDLFLALFEQRTRSYVTRFIENLSNCHNRRDKLVAFRAFYTGLARERTWPILVLEFKLFALRHPDSRERLRRAFEMSKPTKNGTIHEQLFGQRPPDQARDLERRLAALWPIVSGLMLETHFEPEHLSEEGLSHILGQIFDALFGGTDQVPA
ncbi:MAG: TetR/AcrR family transcriptional regulator [Acidobacteriota bacterium]